MDDAPAAGERTPWWRYALAATLGLSILGLTYVLFDPDLGTPVPLFQEFTCRGKLDVFAGNVRDEEALIAPQMALKMRTLAPDGTPVLSYVSIYRREAGEEWGLYIARAAVGDPDLIFLERITNDTEVYVEAKDLEGRYCAAESPVIRTPREAAPSDPQATQEPTPSQPTTPGSNAASARSGISWVSEPRAVGTPSASPRSAA